MKSGLKIIITSISMLFFIISFNDQLLSKTDQLMDGDIIFQKSRSSQASALRKATGSDLTHVGIIFIYNKKPYVIEALQPVVKTPYGEFVRRFGSKNCIVKRLANRSDISALEMEKLRKNSEHFIGKNYDLLFRWSDDKIYCSELVWKAYHNALGLDLGTLQKIKDFNLTSPEVKQLMRIRGMDKQSMDETVITPVSIFSDKRLITVN